jgi:murein DD-endopeptidase / murein LD-carboxypeptidase
LRKSTFQLLLQVLLFLGLTNALFAQNTEKIICADSLITKAKSYLGTHYQYASCSPEKGFDCSGFVHYVFAQFEVKAPRSSIDYGSIKSSVLPDSAKIGDVIVFTGTNAKNRRAGHVGIVISNPGEELTFIHSSSNKKRGGVIISTYKSSPYYEKRFIKIIRLKGVKVEKCGG